MVIRIAKKFHISSSVNSTFTGISEVQLEDVCFLSSAAMPLLLLLGLCVFVRHNSWLIVFFTYIHGFYIFVRFLSLCSGILQPALCISSSIAAHQYCL